MSLVKRLAIGTPEKPASHVWRFWIRGDDVYFGAKETLSAFKISLHKSGVWRIAFVEELEREDDSKDRVIQKWHRPPSDSAGLTPSIAVLISPIRSTQPFKQEKVVDSRIDWFPVPILGRKLNLKVVFSDPNISEEDVKKLLPSNVKPACCLTKVNGEKVWVILIESDLTDIEKHKILDVMSKTKIHLKPGTDSSLIGGSRALLVVSETVPTAETQPTIFDIELGKENLSFGSPETLLNK